jgi:transposase
MARPVKLTDDLQRHIISALRIGATHEHAARAAGISSETMRRWMRAGERATRGQFCAFCGAVKKAEAEAAVGWLATIEKAAREGAWTAAAWKLERRYPEQWGRRDRMSVEHSGALDVGVEVRALQEALMSVAAAHPEARGDIAQALLRLADASEGKLDDGRTVDSEGERPRPHEQHNGTENGYHHAER